MSSEQNAELGRPQPCCQTLLYAEPLNGDTARCRCGLAWIARTAPHVGQPTWWPAPDLIEGLVIPAEMLLPCPIKGPHECNRTDHSDGTRRWFCAYGHHHDVREEAIACDRAFERSDPDEGTARVHAARDELLKDETARAAYEAQKARIDARVAERRGDHSDGEACGNGS